MKKLLYVALSVVGLLTFVPQMALATSPSISIQALSPANATVFANDRITFTVTASGFVPASYQLIDSYRGTSVTLSNISGGGNFFWVPLVSDVGVHTFAITVSDNSSNTVSATQTVTVLPPPALSVGAVKPDSKVMPGTSVSFNLNPTGFTNPRYSISDSFSGSSAVTATVDASGIFTWTPELDQNGEHTISIYATDSLGHSASAQQWVRVGAGPSLGVMLLAPGPTVPVGTTTTFLVTSSNFSPTAFSVSDSFPGSTLSNSNISATGSFIWSPQSSDIGVHTLTIYGVVGSFGASATTSLKLTVTGVRIAPVAVSTPVPIVSAAATSSSVTDRYVFANFMGYGEDPSDGSDVLELQKRLVTLGFLSAKPNGYFGKVTELAVKKFQKAHKISQTGYVGSLTRAALNQ